MLHDQLWQLISERAQVLAKQLSSNMTLARVLLLFTAAYTVAAVFEVEVNSMRIREPAGLAGEFDVALGDFGATPHLYICQYALLTRSTGPALMSLRGSLLLTCRAACRYTSVRRHAAG